MKYIDGFRDPKAARYLTAQIEKRSKQLARQSLTIRLMEVCGSHTMAIARFGIHGLLPPNVQMISGPGCPVCVTDAGYIDTAIELASKDIIIATFGDLMRVPGSDRTLSQVRSEGGRVEICYSPLDALTLAKDNPQSRVVFLAIGFETTVAPVISLIKAARAQGVENVSLLTAFKTVPAALEALTSDPEVNVNGFVLPAHVSAIIGEEAYRPFVEKFNVPCVIAGFEPLDILYGVDELAKMLVEQKPGLVNQYSRVVKPAGNVVAQKLMSELLQVCDVSWRGIGVIGGSGLELKKEFDQFNAIVVHNVKIESGNPDKRCKCGDVLKGKIKPSDCALFGKKCNPTNPIGPCMVSSEGSCAAYYKYAR